MTDRVLVPGVAHKPQGDPKSAVLSVMAVSYPKSQHHEKHAIKANAKNDNIREWVKDETHTYEIQTELTRINMPINSILGISFDNDACFRSQYRACVNDKGMALS